MNGLLELLGGFFCWVWSPKREEFVWRLLYWKLEDYPVRTSQVLCMNRMRYWSGFRTWTRGRHWDRRTRYGEK